MSKKTAGKTDRSPMQLIGYCGIYCGDCPGHTAVVADLARDLRKQLRMVRFDKLAQVLAEFQPFKTLSAYPQCYQVLGAMTHLRCTWQCRGRAAAPPCEIRKCCRRHSFEGCWQCGEFVKCTKLDILKAGHGDAHIRNLRKLKRLGPRQFVEGKRYWHAEPRGK